MAEPGGVVVEDLCQLGYSLEVANDTSDRVKVQVWLAQTVFEMPGIRESDIVLAGGERRTFEVSVVSGCGPVLEHNRFVRSFSEIRFYDEGSEAPFRSYLYPVSGCGDAACSDNEYMHQSSTGTWERLFVESPDRPFYFERDENDPDLARIVITFVPSAESGAERVVE